MVVFALLTPNAAPLLRQYSPMPRASAVVHHQGPTDIYGPLPSPVLQLQPPMPAAALRPQLHPHGRTCNCTSLYDSPAQ